MGFKVGPSARFHRQQDAQAARVAIVDADLRQRIQLASGLCQPALPVSCPGKMGSEQRIGPCFIAEFIEKRLRAQLVTYAEQGFATALRILKLAAQAPELD
jgi:hypothetical protein